MLYKKYLAPLTMATKRMALRPMKDTDNLAISALRSNDSVNKYIERPKHISSEEAKAFITRINDGIKQNKCFYWAIYLKNSETLIGTICLWNFSRDKTIAELGYELNPAFQGRGLMNEAIKAILKYGFQAIGLKSMVAYTHKDNESSIRLLEKNNFKFDKNLKYEKNSNYIIFSLHVQNR